LVTASARRRSANNTNNASKYPSTVGKKLIKGSDVAFTVIGLGTAGGALTGTVTNKSFATHFKNKTCKVSIRGRIVSDDLVGTYNVGKTCLGKTTFKGTFDYTFDATGNSCN
jgi:hypothetical protein